MLITRTTTDGIDMETQDKLKTRNKFKEDLTRLLQTKIREQELIKDSNCLIDCDEHLLFDYNLKKLNHFYADLLESEINKLKEIIEVIERYDDESVDIALWNINKFIKINM